MTDEELAEIEEWAKRLWPIHSLMPWFGKLIAEVRRLRTEAETIEVLREWIRKNEMMVKVETRLAESGTTIDKFKELANRRIAALEGK